MADGTPCGKGLNPCFSGNRFGSYGIIGVNVFFSIVLILVLVEIGLGDDKVAERAIAVEDGLNPCFSGNRFGRRYFKFKIWYKR